MDPGQTPPAGAAQSHQQQSPPPPASAAENAESESAPDEHSVSDVTSLVSSPLPAYPDFSTESESPLAENAQAPSISSWSTSSERQLGYGIQEVADSGDRVFPIRSVLNLEGTARPQADQADYFQRHTHTEPSPDPSRSDPGTRQRQDSLAPSQRSAAGHNATSSTISAAASARTAPTAIERSPPTKETQLKRRSTLKTHSSTCDDPHCDTYVSALPVFSADLSDDEESLPSTKSGSLGIRDSSRDGGSVNGSIDEALVTVRFKHSLTEDGHAVITGREGSLQRCEDEPIHAPGAVQGFGLLIALSEDDSGRFIVRYVSENSKEIIGFSPRELFRLDNFIDILTEEQADNLLDHIDFIRDEEADPGVNGPEVFSVSVRPAKGRTIKLWCAIHINPACEHLVICEFELDDDVTNPLRPPGEDTPETPEDTLNSNPTTDELNESTEVLSKPLRVLRSARKRRGESGAMQVFDIMSQVQEQLASAQNLERFLKILVGIVKELTGFHRVMVYQFDSAFNGKVVTELVNPQQTRDLYKGLHFPASDIPKQARELYKINKVRLLYDRDKETARLVCRNPKDLDETLDLTHSYLRAMSPIHLKYLANMAVRSSMSISINAFDELWGLIACHSYGNHGMRVSFPIRKMCRLVGETASRNIERLSYASRLQARKLINTIPTEKNPSGYIIASSDDLLKLFDADFGTLSIHGETKILGKLEQTQEALVMLEYLRMRKLTSVTKTQDVRIDFPDLRYPPGFTFIAGFLFVPLSTGGSDFIVFYRKGQVREVKWAGNPYSKVIKEGTSAYLEPRKSFRVWHETVLGKCRDWTEEQVETAAVLCLVYGKFIEVWRQKEAALQNSKLTRLLLANQAHEVRTPLNAIINYLEIAMEGSLDQETRDNLSKSHSASKSLIYVINDLLDLTKAEEAQDPTVKVEIFDLAACIHDATDPFQSDAKRKGIQYEVTLRPGLPNAVYGLQRRVRTALSNLVGNAMQHTTDGWVKVEAYTVEADERSVRVEFVVQDSGCGMTDAQLDAIFRDLEQVSDDDAAISGAETEETSGRAVSGRTLGLGLAVVARTVRNMDGQLRLKSDAGKGSRFVLQLRFELPPPEPDNTGDENALNTAIVVHSTTSTSSSAASNDGTVRADDSGEVTLVRRASLSGPVGTSSAPADAGLGLDSASIRSHASIKSQQSGMSAKSDADRLIDAIQHPLAIGEPESKEIGMQRKQSKGAYYNQTSKQGGGSSLSSARSMSPVRNAPSGQRRGSVSRSASDSNIGADFAAAAAAETNSPAGIQFVTDSRTPLQPVRIPHDEEFGELPTGPQPGQASGILYELAPDPVKQHHAHAHSRPPQTQNDKALEAAPGEPKRSLHVLCAEDDPINMKLLRKRLEKAGHTVAHSVNGEDCHFAYKDAPTTFDVVLMDMQMPIVDGLTSTKMIRAFEASDEHTVGFSDAVRSHGRIPIFAISASLLESQRDIYVNAGFDGWILKPVDFKRLETLLAGIRDEDVRRECFYKPGKWESGGWFDKDQQSPLATSVGVDGGGATKPAGD